MEKRLVVALAISVLILVAWGWLFPGRQPPPPAPSTPQATTEAAQPSDAGKSTEGNKLPTESSPSGSGEHPTLAPATERPAEELATIETHDARFILSSWGGTLRQVEIKDPKFRHKTKDGEAKDLGIVTTTAPQTAPLRLTFPKAEFQVPDNAAWSVSRPAADTVIFRTETDAVVVEKLYRAEPQRYRLHLTVSVENKTAKPLAESLAVHLYGQQDPDKKGGSFLSYASENIAEMICYVNGKAERHSIDSLVKEPVDHAGAVFWVSAGDKYFMTALVPLPQTPSREKKCGMRGIGPLAGEVFLAYSSRAIEPKKKASYQFAVYAGPKYASELEQVAPAGEVHLEEAVNVSLAVLARPMLFLLKTCHKLTGNWGVAIILLTLFVKLVTFYPTQRSLMSAKKMQKLAPKIAELRKKYGDDRQRMGVETMNLYKAHGVSPFGGCLPALIQMPIWIALFSTLNYAVELHRAPFIGYIRDLSAPDPFYVTPLAMGVVMFLQMRMSPAGADPQQQKMMAVMMPVMFTVFSLFLPAGLAIYTLTSYLLGIVQQLYVNRLDRRSA